MRFLAPIAVLLVWTGSPVCAGVCQGDAKCRACKDCSKCAYCNTGKGSCNVKREAEDRAYAERQRAQRPRLAK